MGRFVGVLTAICLLCGSAGFPAAASADARFPGTRLAKKDKEKQEKVLEEKKERLEAWEEELEAREEALKKKEADLKKREDRLKRKTRGPRWQTPQGVGAGSQTPSGSAEFGPKTSIPPGSNPVTPVAPPRPPMSAPGPPLKQ
jgi:hypothetical protein